MRRIPADVVEPLGGVVVPRREIPDYFTPEFVELLQTWSVTKRWGVMPFEGGWAEQPCRLMDVLNEFDTMFTEWENDK